MNGPTKGKEGKYQNTFKSKDERLNFIRQAGTIGTRKNIYSTKLVTNRDEKRFFSYICI